MLKHGTSSIATTRTDESFTRLANSSFVLKKAEKAKELINKVGLPYKEDALIEKIAKNAKITKGQAANALKTVISSIEDILNSRGKVTFAGVGTFSVEKRTARTARNPSTGKEVKIKATKVAKFNASKELSRKVNK